MDEHDPNKSSGDGDGFRFTVDNIAQKLGWLLERDGLQFCVCDGWLVLNRKSFDMVKAGDPYRVFELMLEMASGKYLSRAWNTTLKRGQLNSIEELSKIISLTFDDTMPCQGVSYSRKRHKLILVNEPYKVAKARDCLVVVKVANKENVPLESVVCDRCRGVSDPRPDDDLPADYQVKQEPKEILEYGMTPEVNFQEEEDFESEEDETSDDDHKAGGVEVKEDPGSSSSSMMPPPVDAGAISNLEAWKSSYINNPPAKLSVDPHALPKPKELPLRKCRFCDFESRNFLTMSKHERLDHLRGPFRCDHCAEQYETVPILMKHTADEHPHVTSLFCVYCREAVPMDERFPQHYKICAERGFNDPTFKRTRLTKENIKCMICDKKYKSWHLLKVHYKWHKGKRDLACDECDFMTYSEFALSTHKLSHKKDRGEVKTTFFCDQCGKSFRHGPSLTYHIEYVHGKKSDDIKCEVCGRHFNRLKAYQRHYHRDHSDDPRFGCKGCGKRYTNMTKVKHCEQSHNGIFPYNCEVCGKGIKRKRSFVEHMRIHTGEKPFQCNLCSYTSKSKSGLYIHSRHVHKGLGLKEEEEEPPAAVL